MLEVTSSSGSSELATTVGNFSMEKDILETVIQELKELLLKNETALGDLKAKLSVKDQEFDN